MTQADSPRQGILAAIRGRWYMFIRLCATFPGPAILHRMTILCLSLAALGGCASDANEIVQSHLHLPLKVLVYESPPKLNAARLQKVFAPEDKKKLTVKDKPLVSALSHSQSYARASMNKDLHRQPGVTVIKATPASIALLNALRGPAPDHALNQQIADQIQQQTGTDAILRFGITDYGLTPKTWRSGYITFEVVTTLGITVAIASIGGTVGKGAAGAYLVQEAVEETAEGYAGFWALDKLCRPVRIEAELIQLKPVGVVWQGVDTGLADVHFTRLFHKVSATVRNAQLDQSTDYAVQSLVTEIVHKLNGIPESQIPAKLKWQLY